MDEPLNGAAVSRDISACDAGHEQIGKNRPRGAVVADRFGEARLP
jgi:hypothetical protein